MRKPILLTLVALTSVASAEDAAPKQAPAAPKPPPAKPAPEEVKAVPAAAKSIVVHVAPTSTEAGKPVELEAMIDAPFAEKLGVRWRAIGASEWHDVAFERSSAGGWFASLPAA